MILRVLGGADYVSQISDGYAIVLTSLFAPATYCFMFISGFFGMQFSFKKLLMMESWLIVCSLLTFFLGSFLFGGFSIIDLIKDFFPISTRRWWFMTYYMLIFIMTPLLNKGIEILDKKDFLKILLLLIGYQIMSFLQFQSSAGSNFLSLLTVYLLGRYCNLYDFKLSKNKSLWIFISSWAILLLLMFLCDNYNKKVIFKLLNYNTPLLMLMSVSLFYYVKGLPPIKSKVINKGLKTVLFIYLITDGFYVPFYKWLAHILEVNLFLGLGLVLLIVVLSMLFGWVIMLMSGLLINKMCYEK